MSSYYTKPRRSQLSRSFMPWYNVSPNSDVSVTQDDSQMTAQALYRETTIGRLMINSYTRFVIGKGLTPMASPESKYLKWTDEQLHKFQEQSEAYWRMVTDSMIDFYGKQGIQDLAKGAFIDICNNGDTLRHIGYRKVKDGLKEIVLPFVQTISGRMVTNGMEQDTKDSVGGVIFKNGREYAYKVRVLGDDFSDTGSTRTVYRYNKLGRLAFDLIQLGQSDPSIVRGIPLLSSLRDDILDTNKFKDNHLMQSAIQNLFTAFVTHEQDPAVPISEKFKEIGLQGQEGKPNEDNSDFYLACGNIVDLEPGENVVFTPRSTANSDYQEGLKANIGLISSALGMSYETAMNTYNASFSASRAGISGTEKNAEIVRLEFIRKWLQGVWETVTEHGILTGHIEVPSYDGSYFTRKALFASTWTGVTEPVVDLSKEVRAYAEAVEAGLCSREFAIRMLFGMDFDEVSDRTSKEKNQTSVTDNDTDNDTDTDNEGEQNE